jgi:hypothetical protein
MHHPKNKGYPVALILITLLFCVGAMGAAQQTQAKEQDKVTQADKVIVYYLHGTNRCSSCMTIERYTRESVEANFSKELKSGQVEFKSINADLPANSHYIKDYKLYTKSVIVADMVQGKEKRWKNLQKVWELLHNEAAFKAYVKSETTDYLQGKRS